MDETGPASLTHQKTGQAAHSPVPRLRAGGGEAPLIINVDGFEGPLDLLLALARNQKVDLAKISILALAEQYLVFVNRALAAQLDLAAEYLVMAAWLAYLKSRLLLPAEPEDGSTLTAQQEAALLAWRLERLQAMREAAARLMTRNRLGLAVFARGAPENVRIVKRSVWKASLYDLLRAYALQDARKSADRPWRITPPPVVPVERARQWLESLFGASARWERLEAFLPAAPAAPRRAGRRSALASTLAAALIMVREGIAEIRQDAPFAPIYLRRCPAQPDLEAAE